MFITAAPFITLLWALRFPPPAPLVHFRFINPRAEHFLPLCLVWSSDGRGVTLPAAAPLVVDTQGFPLIWKETWACITHHEGVGAVAVLYPVSSRPHSHAALGM